MNNDQIVNIVYTNILDQYHTSQYIKLLKGQFNYLIIKMSKNLKKVQNNL